MLPRLVTTISKVVPEESMFSKVDDSQVRPSQIEGSTSTSISTVYTRTSPPEGEVDSMMTETF